MIYADVGKNNISLEILKLCTKSDVHLNTKISKYVKILKKAKKSSSNAGRVSYKSFQIQLERCLGEVLDFCPNP